MKRQKDFKSSTRIFRLAALLFLLLIFDTNAFSQNTDPKLSALRKQFAVKYLHPEAHFALAQYYLDKNDKLQAYLIIEYARRYRFSEKDFDPAFVKFFGDNSAEPDEKAKNLFETGFALLKAEKENEVLTADKKNQAEKLIVEAAKLAPKSAFIQSWTGRFFYRVKSDDARALNYYYNAYFLDPHAYDTEYAEARIRKIALPIADAKFAEMLKSGKSLAEISTDANALIVENAIGEMGKNWKKEYIKPLLDCMSNDDSVARWSAFSVLVKNADATFDEMLTALTTDADFRKRGLAAYALIARRKEKSFDTLKKMLTDKAELIRFDALSALALQGGTAEFEILKAHRKVETNATLQQMIDKTLQNK